MALDGYFGGQGFRLNNKDNLRRFKQEVKTNFFKSNNFSGSQANDVVDKFIDASREIYGNKDILTLAEKKKLFDRVKWDTGLRKKIGLNNAQLAELNDMLEPEDVKEVAVPDEDIENN